MLTALALALTAANAGAAGAASCDGLALSDGRCITRFGVEYGTHGSDMVEAQRAGILADQLFTRARLCHVKDFNFLTDQVQYLDIWLKKEDDAAFKQRLADLSEYIGEAC